MFEVGFTEIVLIFGIALLVLGPARLPKLAADLGRWAGRARAMARQLRTQLEQEVQFDPLATNAGSKPATSPAYTPPPPATVDEQARPTTALTSDASIPVAEPAIAPVESPAADSASAAPTTTTTIPDERQPG